jgi:1-acyl-sn-glycerol-3-phosphate acyltransferase
MAVKKFNSRYLNFLAKIGLIEIIYALFGVFTIKKGLGISKNLEEAGKILAEGGNLVIYPEGEIFQSTNNIGIFKIGAAVLAQRTGASVIPVAMKITKKSHFRKKFTVNIGKRIVVNKDASVSSYSITTNFHNEIFELYKQI